MTQFVSRWLVSDALPAPWVIEEQRRREEAERTTDPRLEQPLGSPDTGPVPAPAPEGCARGERAADAPMATRRGVIVIDLAAP